MEHIFVEINFFVDSTVLINIMGLQFLPFLVFEVKAPLIHVHPFCTRLFWHVRFVSLNHAKKPSQLNSGFLL